MPKPIPNWDLFRVLVGYLLKRQLAGTPTTLKQASNRMGIGSKRILFLFKEQGVEYLTQEVANVSVIEYMNLYITGLPDDWLPLFEVSKSQLETSCATLLADNTEVKEVKHWRTKRKEERIKREKHAQRFFLAE